MLRSWYIIIANTLRVYIEDGDRLYYSDRWDSHDWTPWRISRYSERIRGNRLRTFHGIADLGGFISRRLRHKESYWSELFSGSIAIPVDTRVTDAGKAVTNGKSDRGASSRRNRDR